MRRALALVAALAGCGVSNNRRPADAGAADLTIAFNFDFATTHDLATAADDLATAEDLAQPPPDDAAALGCTAKVNEVQTSGAAVTDEFVELFNPCKAAVDLSGWKIGYRSAGNNGGGADTVLLTLPQNTTLASGGFLVYCGATFTGACDGKLMSGLALAGGAVGLRTSGDVRVDSVAYQTLTGANDFTEGMPAPHPAANEAIARTGDGADSDDNSVDFKVTVTPTPKAANK